MASYSLAGYTPPAGVDSRQKVKEYQTRLGVAADRDLGPENPGGLRGVYGRGQERLEHAGEHIPRILRPSAFHICAAHDTGLYAAARRD